MKLETKKSKKCSRKACKECPWIINSKHNRSWPEYVNSMERIGQIIDKRHACHMTTSDIWGYNSVIDSRNVCVGALQVNGDL